MIQHDPETNENDMTIARKHSEKCTFSDGCIASDCFEILGLPVQSATGGRSGVSVYKAGRSVPLDSAQLDLSRLALAQLGSVGVEKCFDATSTLIT